VQPGQSSVTAERAALMRAAHRLLDRPVVFDDPLAARLLDGAARAWLDQRPASLDSPVLRALRACIAARQRYAEDRLRDAVGRGVDQYVVLGAGFDTFAYRSPLVARGLRVFEVDHPDTQAAKRARLREAGIDVPAGARFVPVDFSAETFVEALRGNGFAIGRPAFVSWLGVTMYLERDAVAGTLAAAAGLAPGTELVVEYLAAGESLDPRRRAARAALAARAAAAGEPWRTAFAAGELAALADGFGLAVHEDIGAVETGARYFRGRADGLAPGPGSRLIHAGITH